MREIGRSRELIYGPTPTASTVTHEHDAGDVIACATCGTEFVAKRARSRFCCRRCANTHRTANQRTSSP
jgi:hypothetical protein